MLIPPYRFCENPPSHIFFDFACGAADVAMNQMSEFYVDTQFYHDRFHGYAHTRCPETMKSERVDHLAAVNTSIMEQVIFLILVVFHVHCLTV